MCMRVPSASPKTLLGGEVGYWHDFAGSEYKGMPKRKRAPEPVINCTKLMTKWFRETRREWIIEYAESLSVGEVPLRTMKPVWAAPHKAWAFAMRDGYNNLIGIRLRGLNGTKWAVPGSHAGIFIPQSTPAGLCLICEGPTDTAAALSLGYFALGRPSCSGGVPHICDAIKHLGIKRVVIVADNDPEKEVNGRMIPNPGLTGAAVLAKHLRVPSTTLLLPAKDLREFVRLGGSRELMDNLIKQLVWTTSHEG